jgi:ribosomal protein S18 acetylase RimI-like enzyme
LALNLNKRKFVTNITPYVPEKDFEEALALWQAGLDHTWPITAEQFQNVLIGGLPDQKSDHFVARQNGRIVGFAATQVNGTAKRYGQLQVIAVLPEAQRQGIGSALYDAALDYFRKVGCRQIRLGGNYPRFWPGIPSNLPNVGPLLDVVKKRGWSHGQAIYDLVRSLEDYTLPDSSRQRMASEGISLAPATEKDIDEILAFETREFAGWLDSFKFLISLKDHADILVARDPKKGIVGTLSMYSPLSNPRRVDVPWKSLLGETVGSLGEVGVAQSERGRGIGLALVAFGSEILKQRSVVNNWIGYTEKVDFYQKLGYKVWQKFEMARLEL